jgi:hypothetical protein
VAPQAGFEESFEQLLAAWNDHQDLRGSNPTIGRLWTSRAVLDQRRLDAARRAHDLVA